MSYETKRSSFREKRKKFPALHGWKDHKTRALFFLHSTTTGLACFPGIGAQQCAAGSPLFTERLKFPTGFTNLHGSPPLILADGVYYLSEKRKGGWA